MSVGLAEITSALANHKTAIYIAKKDPGGEKVVLLGGMMKVRALSHIVIFIRWVILDGNVSVVGAVYLRF